MLILLTSGALFSGGIVSAYEAPAASHVAQHTPLTMSHTPARPAGRPGERSSPGTGGQLFWRYLTFSSVDSSPAVVNGVVYVGSGDDHVYALNASNGTVLWQYPTGGEIGSSPAVVNGVVYIGSFDHYIYALNASTGTLLWHYLTGNSVDASPVVARGVVYIGSSDAYMYALKASNGTVRWRYQMGGSFGPYSRAVVVRGMRS